MHDHSIGAREVPNLQVAPDPAVVRPSSRRNYPLISVVIPTYNRPRLVERAVCSALNQSLSDVEVVVVVDGPDPETEATLKAMNDERLHLLCLHKKVGGSEARNIGVRYSRSKWIALLDDDDEWFPGKLAAQWNAGESMAGRHSIVGTRFLERTECAERSLPGRMPPAGEAFSDYLFVRKGWHSGEGFLQTSTWLISRQLLLDVPFTRDLKRCQDLDWLLHATALPETKVLVLPEVLAVFHHDEREERVSRSADWRFLYEWAVANRRYLTSTAFSFFIATFCVPSAAKQREGLGTFLFLLRQCIFAGTCTCKCLALFVACWWVPEGLRRNLRAFVRHLGNSYRRRYASMTSPIVSRKAG